MLAACFFIFGFFVRDFVTTFFLIGNKNPETRVQLESSAKGTPETLKPASSLSLQPTKP